MGWTSHTRPHVYILELSGNVSIDKSQAHIGTTSIHDGQMICQATSVSAALHIGGVVVVLHQIAWTDLTGSCQSVFHQQ